MAKKPTFTVGIEEEYLLVDKETCGPAVDPPCNAQRDVCAPGIGRADSCLIANGPAAMPGRLCVSRPKYRGPRYCGS